MQTQIDKAVAQFKDLLLEQIDREEKMKNSAAAVDFKNKKTITIGVVGGDGIGPLIVKQAKRVIDKLLEDEIKSGKVIIKEIDGLTIENRLALGEAVPKDVLAEIKQCDVLLKGPTTTPKGGSMESANVALRRELDLYANVRPVTVPEQNIDWIFYRENTEGEYVLGSRGIEIDDTLAMDFKVTTLSGTTTLSTSIRFWKA